MPVSGKPSSGPSREWKQLLNKTKQPKYTYKPTLRRSPQVSQGARRSQGNSSKSRAFITLTLIVLFTIFSGSISTIPAPSGPITNASESTEYIQDISPAVGNAAVQSITLVLDIITPIAELSQFLVTNITSIAGRYLNFIGIFTLEVGPELSQECVSFEQLDGARQTFMTIQYSFYRSINIFNDDVLTSVSDYWNSIQLRDYDLVCV